MFQLNVLQNQWLVFALAGGLALVLVLALYYLAMWRERPGGQAVEGNRRRWFPPALLILAYVVIPAWVIVYTLMHVWNPPNW